MQVGRGEGVGKAAHGGEGALAATPVEKGEGWRGSGWRGRGIAGGGSGRTEREQWRGRGVVGGERRVVMGKEEESEFRVRVHLWF